MERQVFSDDPLLYFIMKRITTTPDQLDNIKYLYDFHHFTVGLGKKHYHYITTAKNSAGIYYAWRQLRGGQLSSRRALEPSTEIHCFVDAE